MTRQVEKQMIHFSREVKQANELGYTVDYIHEDGKGGTFLYCRKDRNFYRLYYCLLDEKLYHEVEDYNHFGEGDPTSTELLKDEYGYIVIGMIEGDCIRLGKEFIRDYQIDLTT